ncbi:hypothetical protein FQR65_LT09260 [Abscondita terminalis]|nr:hypothetical protein FQR65_LT09260 [Abscondita terminalis]
MCEKNIKPAINVPNDTPKELSAEEFQQRLYDWFHERGLLTELRAHLRKQMIGVLKDSPVGHTITAQQNHQCLSPKLQALNLLIGEFLLCNNYHYTLSVFSTESPAISLLPEFPLSLTPTEAKNKQWRFIDKTMLDILETFGIQRDSELGEKVFQSYYKNESDPLLTNIMNCIRLSNKTVQSSPSYENVFACTSYEEWIKAIGELLHVNNRVPSETARGGLETQQQRLQIGFDTLYREQKAVEDLQEKLQQEINEQRAKFNVTFFDDIQKMMSKEQPAAVSKENDEEGVVEIADKSQSYHQELIVQLQIENRALQNVNLEQKARIDELTERSALLLRDLESTQAAVNILSSSSTALNSRRLPARRVNGLSSSSTDEGTTSQMLKDARDKLRRLEQESDEVDRHYQSFKLKRDQDVFSLPCRYRTYETAPWLSDINAEVANKFGIFETPQKPSTSSSSLMEYVPYRTQLTTPPPSSFEFRSPEHTSVKAGPSNVPTVTVEKIEDAVCKDTENTTSSSGLDLGTSGMSFSHIDSSEEKTTTEQ